MSVPFVPCRLGVGAAALLTVAITGGPAAGQEPVTVTVGTTFLASSLDPADGRAGRALTSHGVGQGVFSVDPDGNLVPVLDETVKPGGDGRIVSLRADRRSPTDHR